MKIDAFTTFESLAAIDISLPAIAAPFVFCNGEENLLGFDVLPAGVSRENIAWLANNHTNVAQLYAALGMAFWRYANSLRMLLLKSLPEFDPFTVCPYGGLAPEETSDSLFAVAAMRPTFFMVHWGKFRAINCKCMTVEKQCGVATYRYTEIVIDVLERIRRVFPDRAAFVDQLPVKRVFY